MRATPQINTRYWLALAAASVFGTNTGDFAADKLHIGHLAGLPYLALAFLAILLLDRATRNEVVSIACFWAAINTVRTAATNIGDAVHDFGISLYLSVPLMLLVFMGAVAWYIAKCGEDKSVRVDAGYWGCMILAGVLGTVGGDFAAFRAHLTPVGAAVAFALLALVAAWAFGRRGALANAGSYWTTVALIRTGGTAAGDALAHGLGLHKSTAFTGIIFCALVGYHLLDRPAAIRAQQQW